MKSEKEIEDKIKHLEEYLERGKPVSKEYPLERTESFVSGLKWVIGKD